MYLDENPNLQQVAGITPQTCSLPYPRDCGDETCHRPEIPVQAEHGLTELSLDASNGVLDGSEDIRITKTSPVGNEPGSSNEAEQGEKICSPTENPEHCIDICISLVGISEDSITKCECDDNKKEDLHSSCIETPTVPSHEVSDAVDDKATCVDGQMIDAMANDVCEEEAAKRRRLMPLQ
jgi:sentrin-specific protease 7